MEVTGGIFTERRSGDKYPPQATDTEVNSCFSIYKNCEIMEHKNDDFKLTFTVTNDYNHGS